MDASENPTLTATDVAASIVGGDLHALPPAHARAFAARVALRAEPLVALAPGTTNPRHVRGQILGCHAAAHVALLAALGESVDRGLATVVLGLLQIELGDEWRLPLPTEADAAFAAAAATATAVAPEDRVGYWLEIVLASAMGTDGSTAPATPVIPREIAVAATRDDFQTLTTRKDPGRVADFVARPLWGPAQRSALEPVLAQWTRRLQEVLLPELDEDYQLLVEGKPRTADELRRALERSLNLAGSHAPSQPPAIPQQVPASASAEVPPVTAQGTGSVTSPTQLKVGRVLSAEAGQPRFEGRDAPPGVAELQATLGSDSGAAAQQTGPVAPGTTDLRFTGSPPAVQVMTAPQLRVPLSMLSDEALADDSADVLDFRPYADALAGLITDPTTATPLTLAINAPWGAGKSTLARLVERRLEGGAGDRSGLPHITCWFNAWAHDDADDLTGAFVATVAQSAARERAAWRRWLRPVPSALLRPEERARRRTWRLLLLALAAVALAGVLVFVRVVTTDLLPQGIETALPATPWLLVLVTAVLLLNKAFEAARTVGEFVTDPKSVAATGSVSAVRRQLEVLIDQASRRDRRLVIFIDDLERCRPPRPVELLEVVNQLLCHRNVVTVILADMPALAACVEIKYRELAERYRPSGTGAGDLSEARQAYGRLYLQKIVQLQFDIPPHTPERIRALVEKLVAARGPTPGTQKRPAGAAAGGMAASASSTEGLLGALGQALRRGGHAAVELLASGRRARTARAYRQQTVAAVRARPTADVEEVLRAAPAPASIQATARNIAREAVQRSLVQPHSDIWTAAEGEALKHLPPLPRNAKRLINRLRLLIFIAQERHIFARDRQGTAERIGKWGVLCERWPELAVDAAQLEEYAQADKGADFRTRVGRQAPIYTDDPELWAFCRSEPALRPMLSALLHMEVDKEPPAMEGAAAQAPSML